jgi:transcriptional regulator
MSQQCETSIQEGKAGPWAVSDAPERYINIMKKNIIGIKVSIENIGGKFKMSQEIGQGYRNGVIGGFTNFGSDVGTHLSEIVKEGGEMKDM